MAEQHHQVAVGVVPVIGKKVFRGDDFPRQENLDCTVRMEPGLIADEDVPDEKTQIEDQQARHQQRGGTGECTRGSRHEISVPAGNFFGPADAHLHGMTAV